MVFICQSFELNPFQKELFRLFSFIGYFTYHDLLLSNSIFHFAPFGLLYRMPLRIRKDCL